jgi:mRNA-degrading endonuclease RelE of RelBE toxin-antitoxin system
VLGALRYVPSRVGKSLREPFTGHWSVRRAAYRVIYIVDEDQHLIVVAAGVVARTAAVLPCRM